MFKSNNIISNTCFKSLLIVCSALIVVCPIVIAQNSQDAINVDVIYPQQIEHSQTIVLTGTIEAKQHAQLGPLEAGRVATLNVEIGDSVTSGQQLLTLDSQLAELEVVGALAEVKVVSVGLNEAQRLYKEAQKLSEQKVVAKTLIAERAALVARAKAQLARADATLSLQQERLNRHGLKAPFDGVIAQRNVDIGEWITQQTRVLVLVAQNDLRLSVTIPQQYYSQLTAQPDVAVKVVPDFAGSHTFAATLSRLVPISDSTTRTFAAQIDLPIDTSLVAGMSARAEIDIPNTSQSSIALPRAAVKQHPDGGSSVFIAENGVAKRLVIEYTAMPNNMVIINNQPADKAYIITGVELLQEGTAIIAKVVETNDDKGVR